MPRRVSLPTADDLFRPTVEADDAGPRELRSVRAQEVAADAGAGDATDRADDEAGPRRTSGRVRHDEKMTVYVTSDELLDLEHARLALRRHHGVAVDRGRLVREAITMALADLEEHGADSGIVQRLLGPDHETD
jgi:hypothetical protein